MHRLLKAYLCGVLTGILLVIAFACGSQGQTMTTGGTISGGGTITAGSGGGGIAYTVSLSSLNFGGITVGSTSSTQTVTLSVVASGLTLANPSVTITGDFAISQNFCTNGLVLNPNSHCDVYVTFSPTQTGLRTGNVTFTTTNGSPPSTVVSLSGTGNSGSGPITTVDGYCSSGNVWTGPVTESVAVGGITVTANFPTRCFYTALGATPSNGTVRTVATATDMTNALTAAACGDIIDLNAGISITGNFTIPTLTCDSTHWLTIRSHGILNANFPAYGTRALPCYFNVASLTGRPAFSCTGGVQALGAQIITNNATSPLTFPSGANFIRLMGLEITRTTGNGGQVFALVDCQNCSDHIILDRVWIHGSNSLTSADEVRNGAVFNHGGPYINGTQYGAVIDSYFNDVYCITGIGACVEGHAILHSDGNGSTQGPFKIVNNFLEAGGVITMIGGNAGNGARPMQDVESRLNHRFKPLTWNPGDAAYNGGISNDGGVTHHAIGVKNNGECKNCLRYFAEAEIYENNWVTIDQIGWASLLTPKTQFGASNTCVTPDPATCYLQDIIMRYIKVTGTNGPIQISNAKDDNGGPAPPGRNYVLHDWVIDNAHAQNCYQCGNSMLQFGNDWGTSSPGLPQNSAMHDVALNHFTIASDNFSVPPLGQASAQIQITGQPVGTGFPDFKLIVANSILDASFYGIFDGNSGSCGNGLTTGLAILNNCLSSYTFDYNCIPHASSANHSYTGIGAHNILNLTAMSGVLFTNYNSGVGGNYVLQGSSTCHNAASDGNDIGANVSLVNQYIANVP